MVGKLMEKVLVTGSAGFIGGYIIAELLEQKYQVVGLDNLSKYGRVTRSFEENSNYKFVVGDASNTELLVELMKDCDHVIGGAALIGGISYFHEYAYDLLAKNERMIAALCDAAILTRKTQKRLKKVTFMSSSMVYESTDRWPSKEGDETLIPPPKSSYGFQKLAVEYFARAAWDQYQLPYTICRPFNCVGIGEARAIGGAEIKSGDISLALSHVVPDIIQKILKGQQPLHLLGDGKQVRHYTYGGDLAKGVVAAMASEKALNEDFNLSTDTSTTVLELVELIWSKINPEKELKIIFDKPFKHDVQKRIPDVEKARRLLDFEASTTLSEMLDEVIPWIKSAINQNLI